LRKSSSKINLGIYEKVIIKNNKIQLSSADDVLYKKTVKEFEEKKTMIRIF
jgi:hypothetical protein